MQNKSTLKFNPQFIIDYSEIWDENRTEKKRYGGNSSTFQKRK